MPPAKLEAVKPAVNFLSADGIGPINAYIESHFEESLNRLVAWLKIPSISALPQHKSDVLSAADHASRLLQGLGFKTELLTTKGHPSLYGERVENPSRPTVLVYGHLDVQPVDPLNQWKKPPFEPWLDDGRLYGRGSADDKGQVMIHIAACEAWLKTKGSLPVNLKFIIEGEEEIGSPNFEDLVSRYKDKLASSVVLISDTAMIGPNCPTVAYATRGLIYFELHVEGPKTDLHSGSFGGVVVNPALSLAQILARMIDAKGRVTIPGFYNRVAPLTAQERRWFKMARFLGKELSEASGVACIGGEKGKDVIERVWARPTFEVHGLSSGFQGTGSKTIIPQKAMAKVSMRLVPGQQPRRIAEVFKKYVAKLAPHGVKVSVVEIPGGGPAFLEDVTHPAFKAAAEALQTAFGKEPVFARCGGSIFAPEIFKRAFPKTPVLLMGFGLPGENAHAPNEWLDLENFRRGIKACSQFYHLAGALAKF